MTLFVGLLVLRMDGGRHSQADRQDRLRGGRPSPLLAAILIRCGTVPAHCWVTDWFENASPGVAFARPFCRSAACMPQCGWCLPIAPGWILQSIGLLSLFTAVYAAAMATIQREARRFFAQLFLSHASLVLVGLELHTELSLTASLCLWFSVILSLGGFGLTLRALERDSAGSHFPTTTVSTNTRPHWPSSSC